tara:strand:+ start:242 stop:517 length:276 start_codon:yes stop_codon:yes gene_type:complete
MDDPHSYYYYEQKQREAFKKKSMLIRNINIWLRGEISDVRQSHPTHDVEPDRHELGILDGRYECATNLLEKIKDWQEELKEWQEDKEKYNG